MFRIAHTIIAIFLLVLTGCASTIPEMIRQPIADSPTFQEATAAPERYVGQAVRWGGVIINTENREQETWLEISVRQLYRKGRPIESDQSAGRFLARVNGFLDPSVYTTGRQVTVNGIIEGVESRKIGDYPYTYILIKTNLVYLWEQLPEYRRDYYYDPYWRGPWYPWGYPYRHYPHRYHH